MASNLPPGVTDRMIPGNGPEDQAFEIFCEDLIGMLDKAQIESTEGQLDILAVALWDYISGQR